MTAHPASGSIERDVVVHRPVPGPPTDREIAILQRVLASAEVDGAAQLRDQIRMLQVVPESTPTCRIYVLHPDVPRAAFSREGLTRIPGTYSVRWLDGSALGRVAVSVENGHVRALQYVALNERVPLTLPPPEWVQLPSAATPLTNTSLPAPPPVTDGDRAHPRSSVVEAAVRGAVIACAATGRDEARRASVDTAPAVTDNGRGVLLDMLRAHTRAAVALGLCVLIIILAAIFAVGAYSGPDIGAAARAGEQAGQRLGADDGSVFGVERAVVEGQLAGYDSTYQTAFDTARERVVDRARQKRRRDAIEAREAAAATTAAATVCPGYVDNRGIYVCT